MPKRVRIVASFDISPDDWEEEPGKEHFKGWLTTTIKEEFQHHSVEKIVVVVNYYNQETSDE